MKKIYATFLAGLACLTAFDASAYKVTVEVDNPEAVELKLSDGTPIALTDGVGEAEYDSYNAINVTAIGEYLISDVKSKTSSSSTWNPEYIYNPKNHSISISPYTDGYSYKIETADLAAMRTASITLKVDEPSAVALTRNWTQETLTPTETETVVKYVPGKETPFTLRSVSGKNFYKVTVGETEIPGSYGSYYISSINDGDIIDVQVNYPDIKKQLTFNLSDSCKDGFITGVTVDGENLENWQNAEVQLGSSVAVSFDQSGYNITKFEMNGKTIQNYGSYYSPYSFTMLDDITFDVEAAPYAKVPMTIKVTKAEYIVAYTGYNQSNPIKLNDGETTIQLMENEGPLKIVASSLATISSVTQDGSPLSKDYSNIYNVPVIENSIIEVVAEEIRRDDTFVFYFDSPAKANDQSLNLYGYALRAENSRREVTLSEGYNEVKYGTAVDGQFMFTVNNGKTDNVFLYVNGVIPSFTSDYMTYNFTPENGDVLKCFVGERPESYSLTFDVEAELTPEVTVDKITALDSLEDMTVLQGTSVSIAPAEGQSYSVKANGQAMTATEGVFELAINADTVVKIEKDDSAVTEIEAEGADNEVYNLQGIRVNRSNLPAGIYIINGKKAVIR